jgi:hypothetical protein
MLAGDDSRRRFRLAWIVRVTYLAHASVLIESNGVRLLTDPWLDGPTYLGAWWQFPEPLSRRPPPVDCVYLTHEHADHFHPPTLAHLPRETEILVGRFARPRFAEALRRLGFSRVRELDHGRTITLGDGLELTSFQYRADDTALLVRGRDATVLNMNDALHRGSSLDQILSRAPGGVDLLLMSFANAEAYPIVYDSDEPPDWNDSARFDDFLGKVRRIGPRAFAPFASMFCFLDEDLAWLNERIVTPAPLLARASETAAVGLAIDPGDVWTPAGVERRAPVRWEDKPAHVAAYAARHADELRARRAAEVVPGGRNALRAAFSTAMSAFWQRAARVGRGLDLSVLFDVEGDAGQPLWARFSGGRMTLDAPATDDAWDVRISIRDWPLWRVLTGAEWWQSLGISCRFRVQLRPGVRAREVQFWALLYVDDMGYLPPTRLFGARPFGVAWRRRREIFEHAVNLLRGRFVSTSLRGKFQP